LESEGFPLEACSFPSELTPAPEDDELPPLGVVDKCWLDTAPDGLL
jgi:hypothetical protein